MCFQVKLYNKVHFLKVYLCVLRNSHEGMLSLSTLKFH